ncbi:hypothetical protein [Methanobrevibacter sp.]|uniref:hypothetical protein n=1 Tax=Methanobrevibacter sp. TaxID=66852 RepID=UPI0025F971A5|nr:hypothetical protein [Methanobrevibacter sp.]MEE0942896.1 hypothetical protein [Methanobrevibacter sp.]
MKLKLAIIFGALIWFLTYFLTNIFNPIFNNNLPYVNIMVPILIIIITGFFGILYIRNINENEVVEGLLAGIAFIIVNMILDYIFFIIPNVNNPIIGDYPFHITSMIIITLLITTFLGYLAQMRIDLK